MDKKNSSMVTRSMGEGALFSFVMLLVFLYIMYTYGYLQPFENWEIGIRTGVTLILLPVVFRSASASIRAFASSTGWSGFAEPWSPGKKAILPRQCRC